MLLLIKIRLLRAWLLAHPQGRFGLIALGVYAIWVLGYEQVLDPDGRLDQALSTGVAATAAGLLQAVGIAAGTAVGAPTTVTMHGEPAVFVGNPCNGLVLYVLFAGFVLAYPGSIQRKAWFVPAGIGAIYLLNASPCSRAGPQPYLLVPDRGIQPSLHVHFYCLRSYFRAVAALGGPGYAAAGFSSQ
jgi:hypothetical protein